MNIGNNLYFTFFVTRQNESFYLMGCEKINTWIRHNLISLNATNSIKVVESKTPPFVSKLNIIDTSCFMITNLSMAINNINISSRDRLCAIKITCDQWLKIIDKNPTSKFIFVFDYSYDPRLDSRKIMRSAKNIFGESANKLKNIDLQKLYFTIKDVERKRRVNNMQTRTLETKQFQDDFIKFCKDNLSLENQKDVIKLIYSDEFGMYPVNLSLISAFSSFDYAFMKIYIQRPNVSFVLSNSEADIAIGSIVARERSIPINEITIYSNDSDMITFARGANLIRRYRTNHIIHGWMKIKTSDIYKRFGLKHKTFCFLPLLLGCDYTKGRCGLQGALAELTSTSTYVNRLTPNEMMGVLIYRHPELFEKSIEYKKFRFADIKKEYIYLYMKVQLVCHDWRNINWINIESLINSLTYINVDEEESKSIVLSVLEANSIPIIPLFNKLIGGLSSFESYKTIYEEFEFQ